MVILYSSAQPKMKDCWYRAGPVNNILVVPWMLLNSQSSPIRRHGSSLPPPLEKYANSTDEIAEVKAYLGTHGTSDEPLDASYVSVHTMNSQIEELQVFNFLLIRSLYPCLSFVYFYHVFFLCLHAVHLHWYLGMLFGGVHKSLWL